ncbi:MAG: hypothetical protein NZT92_08325 [Abditibacteriales bacterium]|nr:hypothetical protein [Abditibacteriales bacterium]MDW8365975.1 hypothetical protein [Abditibacteriales bacterium]
MKQKVSPSVAISVIVVIVIVAAVAVWKVSGGGSAPPPPVDARGPASGGYTYGRPRPGMPPPGGGMPSRSEGAQPSDKTAPAPSGSNR